MVSRLLQSVQWVVVVDNASSDVQYLADLADDPRIKLIRNETNRGVSAGINQIIRHAREVNARFVIAFDQDTVISEFMVTRLVEDFDRLESAGEHVAAIGPVVVDDFTDHCLPFVHFRFPFNTRFNGSPGQQDRLVECHFLISSGCLMSMRAIEEIGLMNEDLFIDNVDLDWCFRALDKRYKVYGNFGGMIRQRIGENCTQIPFTKSVIRYHDAGRHYYMTRNRFWLYRQAYVSGAWVFHDVCRFAAKFVYLLVFKQGRLDLVRSSARGIVDSFQMESYKHTKVQSI